MPSYKISATISDKEAARTLSGALSELVFPPPDAMTMFEAGEDWLVEGYYNEAPDLQGLSHQLGAVLPFPVPPLRLEEVPDENWVAISQAALPPVTAGRFIVHGSHDIGRVPRGPNTLLIDAGEAFGTAHHATTQGCLMALDELSRKRRFERVLDLGCGSGVLAIAASRVLRGAQIDASDNDPVAIAVARSNARRNGAATCIRMRVAEGIPRGTLPGTYDLILANILADPLIALAPDIARALVPGGVTVLSGLLNRQAAPVIATYRAHGFALVNHRRLAGWSTLTLVKRRNGAACGSSAQPRLAA
jgi:Ribosomal protein L11 methylase